MTTKGDGGPAYPVTLNPGESWDAEKYGNPNGMSLRDYFAAASLTGFVREHNKDYYLDAAEIARRSYELADAMLAARARTGDDT